MPAPPGISPWKLSDAEESPSLSIATEKICFIVVKAREFDVKDVETDPNDTSNATDDSMISVLEDHRENSARSSDRLFNCQSCLTAP